MHHFLSKLRVIRSVISNRVVGRNVNREMILFCGCLSVLFILFVNVSGVNTYHRNISIIT